MPSGLAEKWFQGIVVINKPLYCKEDIQDTVVFLLVKLSFIAYSVHLLYLNQKSW